MVLAVGGQGGTLVTSEFYDSTSGTWTTSGGLATGRSAHTANLLLDGNPVIAGDYGEDDSARASGVSLLNFVDHLSLASSELGLILLP